jgi:hypothetical protein
MSIRSLPARLTTALAAVLSLAACGGTVDFSVEKDLDVNSTVNGGAVLATVDLAAEAGGAWKHRNKIDSISVTTAEATVTSVSTPPNTATTVSGEVWLLPEGATTPGAGAVQAGTFTDEAVTVGNVIGLALTPELNAFVRGAFNGSGKFGVYAVGTGAGGQVVACRLHLVLGAKVKWSAF